MRGFDHSEEENDDKYMNFQLHLECNMPSNHHQQLCRCQGPERIPTPGGLAARAQDQLTASAATGCHLPTVTHDRALPVCSAADTSARDDPVPTGAAFRLSLCTWQPPELRLQLYLGPAYAPPRALLIPTLTHRRTPQPGLSPAAPLWTCLAMNGLRLTLVTLAGPDPAPSLRGAAGWTLDAEAPALLSQVSPSTLTATK